MGAGIDWGNTNTVVVFKAGGGEHVFLIADETCIPSYLQYDDEGNLAAIGREAKNALRLGTGHVVAGLKRLIGAAYDMDIKEWAESVYGLNLRPGEKGRILVQVGQSWKSPEQMATEFFQKLHELVKEQAQKTGGWLANIFGGNSVDQCVVTCPVQYLENQKNALKECLAKGDFELAKGCLVPEPAAVCKLLPTSEPRNTIIIDWGGGTLDFAFVAADGECLGLSGVQSECGGVDMDHAILQSLQNEGRLPRHLSPIDRCVAREFVEARKERVLSSDEHVPSDGVFIPDDGSTLTLDFQREEVARWIGPICRRAQNAADNTIYKEDLDIQRCILVGGPFCSEYLRETIREVLPTGCEIIIPEGSASPMTAVATGACRFLRDENGPPPPPVHDYGMMVDLLDHKMGVLLLRGDQQTTESPSREMRLLGWPGTTLKIEVFARKINPASGRQTYETSSTFHFQPQFHNYSATIRVSLETDAKGTISARVIDVHTNQEMHLPGIGEGVSRTMQGPPCRSMAEEPGLRLLCCWHETRWDASEDTTGNIEQLVNRWIDICIPPSTVEALWQASLSFAEDCLRLDRKVVDSSKEIHHSIEAVTNAIQTGSKGEVTVSVLKSLLRDLEDVLTYLVREYGRQDVEPTLTACDAYCTSRSFQSTTDLLVRLMKNFQGTPDEFSSLVRRVSEARNDIERRAPDNAALNSFATVLTIATDRYSHLCRLRKWTDNIT